MRARLKTIAILSWVLFIALMGLPWLATGLLLLAGLYFVLTQGKFGRWIKKSSFLTGCLAFTGIFVLAILVRVFVFEIYNIPSESMEDTLVPGDKIIVSKLNYGPQLPRSPFEIPWVNLFFYITKDAKANPNTNWWHYHRLEGLSKINRGDIVVFEVPTNANDFYIKRCVGLPGETLEIKSGSILNNDFLYNSPPTIRHSHEDIDNDTALKIQTLDTMATFFPHDRHFQWSLDNFGPLRIPGKGMKLELNRNNLILYSSVLSKYENVDIAAHNGRYYLDGMEIKEYVFRKNYYFMMGDNRNNSQDSRFWGFVPEENVVGKAVCVLYSNHQDGFKWSRVLKLL